MAKPILIVYTPNLTYKTEKENAEQHNQCKCIIAQLDIDYHILFTQDPQEDKFTFKLFSDKEIEPIELEKLKEILNLK